MNSKIRNAIFSICAGLTVGPALADCPSGLTMKEVVAAIGPGVSIQPVLAGGGTRGWRLYGTDKSQVLSAAAIRSGSLLVRVCGEAAAVIVAQDYQVCCHPASGDIELTFAIGDEQRKVVIRRPD